VLVDVISLIAGKRSVPLIWVGFQIEIIFHGTLMGYFPPRKSSWVQSVFTSDAQSWRA